MLRSRAQARRLEARDPTDHSPHPSRRRFAPPQDEASCIFLFFCRFGTVTDCGGPGSATSLCSRRIASGTRDTNGRIPHSHLTMSNSAHFLVPTTRFCVRVLNFSSLTPKSRGGRSAGRRIFFSLSPTFPLSRASAGECAARLSAARTFACANARSPFGAPPWRTSRSQRFCPPPGRHSPLRLQDRL